MRLICPNCGTQYEVSAAAIPAAGRDVQCGACQTSWFQMPEAEETVAPVAPPLPEEETIVDKTVEEVEAHASSLSSDTSEDEEESAPPTSETEDSADAFAAIQKRIAAEAEALEEGRDTQFDDLPESPIQTAHEAEALASTAEQEISATIEAEAPTTTADASFETQRSIDPPTVIETGAEPVVEDLKPLSRDEVAQALAEVARGSDPEPVAPVATAIPDAKPSPLAAEIEALNAEYETKDRKPADVVFDAVSRSSAGAVAATAGIAAATTALSDTDASSNDSLADRLKRRVAEAATEQDGAREDSGLMGASADAVAVASAQKVDRLPDADSLASSLRNDTAVDEDTPEEVAAKKSSGGFWRGIGAAIGVAACALVVYLAAPTISRMAPPLEPALSGYKTQVDAVRGGIARMFGRS